MKNFLLVSLFLIYLTGLKAQKNNKPVKNNTVLFSVCYALNGFWDHTSFLYRSEYIHKFNQYFSAGMGMGFFSNAKTSTSSLYTPNPVFVTGTIKEQSSIINFDIIPYLHVFEIKQHFLNFGIGYSLQRIRQIYSSAETLLYTKGGTPVAVVFYELLDKFEHVYLIYIEYGYKITPNIGLSINARYYGGDYGLAAAGLSFFYLF